MTGRELAHAGEIRFGRAPIAAKSSATISTVRNRAATFPTSLSGGRHRIADRINVNANRPPEMIPGGRFASGNYFWVMVSVKVPPPLFVQVMVPFWNSLTQPPPDTL